MHGSNDWRYSITSSARASKVGGIVMAPLQIIFFGRIGKFTKNRAPFIAPVTTAICP